MTYAGNFKFILSHMPPPDDVTELVAYSNSIILLFFSLGALSITRFPTTLIDTTFLISFASSNSTGIS